jgi:hypothetical protein
MWGRLARRREKTTPSRRERAFYTSPTPKQYLRKQRLSGASMSVETNRRRLVFGDVQRALIDGGWRGPCGLIGEELWPASLRRIRDL